MDEELHGIFLGGVEVRRLDEEALDFVTLGAFEPKRFKRRRGNIGERGVIEVSEVIRRVSELLGNASLGTGFIELSRKRDRRARENEGFPVWRHRKIIVVPVANDYIKVEPRSLLGITIYRDVWIIGAINRKRFHRRFALRLMHEVDAFGIR